MASLLNLIYYVMLVLFASTSAYLSYFGFLRNFQGLAWVFAIVLGLWLFFWNIVIQRQRIAGRSVFGAVVMFLIGAILSFVSNFNFLYTGAMQRDVAMAAIAQADVDFRANLVDARTVLETMDVIAQARTLRSDFERVMERLRSQINDPANPGVGPEAKVHMDEINAILGKPMTNLVPPSEGAGPAERETWFANYSKMANADLEKKIAPLGAAKVVSLIQTIDELLKSYATAPTGGNSENLDILRVYGDRSKDIELEVNALLSPSKQLSLRPIDFQEGRLGEIYYSLHSGFIEWPNVGATILSTGLAVFIDLLPLLMSLFAFQQTSTESFHEVRRPDRRRNNLT